MTTKQIETSPSLSALYLKAVVPRRERGDELDDTRLLLHGFTVDRTHLVAYNRVCGFRLSDELPVTYPHVLTFPLAVKLMTEPSFPFPLAGLVHIQNLIFQHRPLHADEQLDISVHAEDLRPHPKGRRFDVVSVITSGTEDVWTERSTYLKRGEGAGGADDEEDFNLPGETRALWSVPRDVGRRYAAVSGDRNPIHLNGVAARLFGFRRSIAHGMWTKARCMAAFEGRLTRGYEVEVRFKKPVLLPSTVAFADDIEGGRITFGVRGRKGEVVHLEGRITDKGGRGDRGDTK